MPTTTVGRRVEHAHLAFALAVQHALPGTDTTVCWSPYSVASALGLAATGAHGATRDELTALLMGAADAGLAEHGEMLTEAATLRADGGRRGEPPVLNVANTMWHTPEISILPGFASELAGWPNAAIREAPFSSDQEAARRLINADVSETTRGLIPELLDRGTIKRDTLATLVNALYLKVAWRHSFPDRGTQPRPFHGVSGSADVPTMRLAERLGYGAAGGWQVVVLPGAGEVEGVVLLPDGDIATAESTVDADALAGLLAAPIQRQVTLYLPKFRVRAKADLNQVLTGLGVRTMFGNAADFSGISDSRLAVDSVIHEAVLTVDEQGLEGAAATALVMRAAAMVRSTTEPVEVHVDRPFLFLVRHRPSGAIYFLSRVVQP
jgi:serine protease inhibitor